MKILRLDTFVDGVSVTQLVAVGEGAAADQFLGTVDLLYLGKDAVRRSACIKMLFVDVPFRRQRVGRDLVNAACKIAARNGCETLGVCLGVENRDAMAFYAKLGFTFAYEYYDGSAIVSKTLSPVSGIRDPQ